MTHAAEYAVRATLYLARKAAGGPITAVDIAHALAIPRNYLSKILHMLAQAGVLDSTRGPRGGFRLNASPADISVARVIEPFSMPGDIPPSLRSTSLESLLQAGQSQSTNGRYL